MMNQNTKRTFQFPERIVDLVSNSAGAMVISGSRSLTKCRDLAHVALRIAEDNNWVVLIGDARGVDLVIQQESSLLPKIKIVVMGCKALGYFRYIWPHLNMERHLVPGGDKRGSCFAIRDWALAELAMYAPAGGRSFIGIWDGESRGTLITAKACEQLGIAGRIYQLPVKPSVNVHHEWGVDASE
jgi:hypothetical protein